MARLRPHLNNETRVLAGLEQITNTVATPWLSTVVWRWRYELALAVAAPLVAVPLINRVGPLLTFGMAALLAAVVILWPGARDLFARRAWCVITPHRVRTGCAEARIHSRRGRLPMVLLTSSEPFGERVRLWCRAGTGVEDFHAARDLLRTACWAGDVRISNHPRYPHLVTVDVIRRSGWPLLVTVLPAERTERHHDDDRPRDMSGPEAAMTA